MKTIYLYSLSIFLISCELIVEVDLPRHKSKVNASGFITTDSTIFVELSKSIDITDPYFVHSIDEAIVTITYPDKHVSTLTSPHGFYYFNSNDKPTMAGNYTLRVQTVDGEIVEAATTIPKQVNVLDSSITRKKRSNEPMADAFIEIVIEDTPGADYYSVSGWAEGHYIDSNTGEVKKDFNWIPLEMAGLTAQGSDIGFSDLSGVYFSDRLFDGEQKKIRIKCSYFAEDTFRPIVIYISRLSHDYWKLKSTVRLARLAGDNPFTHPVQVYSNVNNGLGVFAGFSLRAVRFE